LSATAVAAAEEAAEVRDYNTREGTESQSLGSLADTLRKAFESRNK